MSAIDRYLAMLADAPRLQAYERAIRRAVRPGDVVVDLGTGVGTLAVLAARAGARRVYAVESAPIGEIALELARANGVEDRVHLLAGRSTEIEPPERADVCLFDDFYVFDLGGDAADTLADARERWLGPRGRLVPAQVELWAAPLGRLPKVVGLHPPPSPLSAAASLELAPLHALGRQTPWPVWLGSARSLLSAPRMLLRERASEFGRAPLDARGAFVSRKAARVSALLCWLRLRLTAKIALDTGPGASRTVYSQALFPLAEPFRVRERERIRFALRYAAPPARKGHHRLWSWQLEGKSGSSSGSTFAQLARTAAGQLARPPHD